MEKEITWHIYVIYINLTLMSPVRVSPQDIHTFGRAGAGS